MKLSLFDYHLPKARIAQAPLRPRDHSRLLVLDRRSKRIKHRHFYDIGEYLRPGDVLVLNNSKVFPARLIGRKPTGGKIEVLLLREQKADTWSCLLCGQGRRVGLEIQFNDNVPHTFAVTPNVREGSRFSMMSIGDSSPAKRIRNDGLGHNIRFGGIITQMIPDGTWIIRFNQSGPALQKAINRFGRAPTPPYIKRASNIKDYQTVFAAQTGSVAAPTAGFHFTKELLRELTRRGVQIEYVTLHVGYGTFAPVKTTVIERHRMHPEFVEVDRATHQRLLNAKREGRRIVAVGTTVVRTLETLPARPAHSRRWINAFIYPGYKFNLVDAMITNFHVPKSTLLMLVSAFAGRTLILKAYQSAIKKKYRFYSFGDAMLIC